MIKAPAKSDDIFLGILFLGLGQLVLFSGVPKLYFLLSKEIENPGTGLSTNDFPIEVLQPVLQWLLDTFGASGMSISLAAIGVGIAVFGWREFLSDKLD